MRTAPRSELFLAVPLLLLGGLWAEVRLQAAVGPLPRNDTELVRAVRDRFERNLVLRRQRLDISASDGVLRLSGTVDRLQTRNHARRVAASVRGVLGIDDGVHVPPDTNDGRVVGRIRNLVSLHLDLSRVAVSVESGVVSCNGRVGTLGRLVFFEDLIARVEGVTEIRMHGLQVEALEGRSIVGERLRVAVLHLIRDPFQFPIAGEIEVELEDDALVLTGRVPRLVDRIDASRVVRYVNPDTSIVDRLEVDPEMGRTRVRDASTLN